MGARGRKSAQALAVLTNIPGQRPEPPAELSEEEAVEWRAVVARMPPDWFAREGQPLLAQYCRSIVRARVLAEKLATFREDLDNSEGCRRVDRLSQMMERETRQLANLASHMRLTQRSRYKAEKAHTAAAKGSERKPWEFGG